MSLPEPTLRTLLLANGGVSAITTQISIGQWPAEDVQPPYVVLQLITETTPTGILSGSRYTTGTIQANCYGTTVKQSRELANAVVAAVSGATSGNITMQNGGVTPLPTVTDAGAVTGIAAFAVDVEYLQT